MDFHQEEIDKKATKLSGEKSGSKEYLSWYHRAYTTIEKEFSEEMWIKYRAEAKRWSTQMPPSLAAASVCVPIVLAQHK